MAVVAIIGMLASMAVSAYTQFIQKANDQIAKLQVRSLELAWSISPHNPGAADGNMVAFPDGELDARGVTVFPFVVGSGPVNANVAFPGFRHQKGVHIKIVTGNIHIAHCRGSLTKVEDIGAVTQEFVRLRPEASGTEIRGDVFPLTGPYGTFVDGQIFLALDGSNC